MTWAILMALGASLSWAITALLMKIGVDSMTRVAFGAIRPWIGLLFIVPYAILTRDLAFGSWEVVVIATAGSLTNAFFSTWLFYYAIGRGPLHKASMLSSTGPFWGVAAAIVFLHEPVSLVTFAAAALVVGGAFLLSAGHATNRSRAGLLPLVAALGSGVLAGFAAAIPTKYCLSHGMSPISYQIIFAASAGISWSVAALPKALARKVTVTRKGIAVAIVSAFFGFFAGWILWLTALERVPASVLSPISGSGTLFTVLLSVVVLRERLTSRTLLGGGLIFAGVMLIALLA